MRNPATALLFAVTVLTVTTSCQSDPEPAQVDMGKDTRILREAMSTLEDAGHQVFAGVSGTGEETVSFSSEIQSDRPGLAIFGSCSGTEDDGRITINGSSYHFPCREDGKATTLSDDLSLGGNTLTIMAEEMPANATWWLLAGTP